MVNNTSAIILAAGKGTRFRSQKQFLMFQGKELWRHVYDKVNQFIENENIVVVGVDIPGGETRAKSVINGLLNLKGCDRVLILEAARPLITCEQIKTILDSDSPSVTFVFPCVDSVIMKDKTYLNRDDCLRMQTPQCFDYELLIKAYLTGKYDNSTEETKVMLDEYGIKPTFLTGGDNLFKITYPNDIKFLKYNYEEESVDNRR